MSKNTILNKHFYQYKIIRRTYTNHSKINFINMKKVCTYIQYIANKCNTIIYVTQITLSILIRNKYNGVAKNIFRIVKPPQASLSYVPVRGKEGVHNLSVENYII